VELSPVNEATTLKNQRPWHCSDPRMCSTRIPLVSRIIETHAPVSRLPVCPFDF
jgi:hypothetical protein